MKNIFIINAHHPYPFSEGKLNATLVEKAKQQLTKAGFNVKVTKTTEEYNIEEEVKNHVWADVIILQSPVNWMGLPWSAKKYIDEVYSAGMQGSLCMFDGRSKQSPKKNYGGGGVLNGKKYMFSLTFNAPEEAFNDKSEYLFQGKTVDDLWFPQHMNFRFFAMEPLPTFSCYDVMKNKDIESDFIRFEEHITKHIINS